MIENKFKQILRGVNEIGEDSIHFGPSLLAVYLENGGQYQVHGPPVRQVLGLQRLLHMLEREVGEARVGRGLEEVSEPSQLKQVDAGNRGLVEAIVATCPI